MRLPGRLLGWASHTPPSPRERARCKFRLLVLHPFGQRSWKAIYILPDRPSLVLCDCNSEILPRIPREKVWRRPRRRPPRRPPCRPPSSRGTERSRRGATPGHRSLHQSLRRRLRRSLCRRVCEQPVLFAPSRSLHSFSRLQIRRGSTSVNGQTYSTNPTEVPNKPKRLTKR
jgi:hypothetical protein